MDWRRPIAAPDTADEARLDAWVASRFLERPWRDAGQVDALAPADMVRVAARWPTFRSHVLLGSDALDPDALVALWPELGVPDRYDLADRWGELPAPLLDRLARDPAWQVRWRAVRRLQEDRGDAGMAARRDPDPFVRGQAWTEGRHPERLGSPERARTLAREGWAGWARWVAAWPPHPSPGDRAAERYANDHWDGFQPDEEPEPIVDALRHVRDLRAVDVQHLADEPMDFYAALTDTDVWVHLVTASDGPLRTARPYRVTDDLEAVVRSGMAGGIYQPIDPDWVRPERPEAWWVYRERLAP